MLRLLKQITPEDGSLEERRKEIMSAEDYQRDCDEAIEDQCFSGDSESESLCADGRFKNVGIPPEFRLTESYVEHCEIKEDEVEWRIVCARLEVIADTHDFEGSNWGKVVRFKDPGGREHTMVLPLRFFASDGASYREMLMDRGLLLEPGHKPRLLLHSYITRCQPKRKILCVDRVGWHAVDDSLCFVFPDHVIGSDGIIFQAGGRAKHAFNASGSLAEWKESIGKYATGNSRLVLSISSSFAAVLLRLLNVEGGGFHFVGPSSIGKTSILRCAGSVFGGGGHSGFIQSWRATANGLEAIAALHNDCVLCLDEMGQVDSSAAGDIAYTLANGVGKQRSDRAGLARPSAAWQLIFVSTGELTLSEKVIESGRKAKAGQEVRVLSIPADAGKGLGVFENIHGFESSASFADHLSDASKKYYGAASRSFIELVIHQGSRISDLAALIQAFTETLNIGGADGQVIRAAKRFGLAAVAGEFAAKHRIVDWPEGEAIKAAQNCFASWLDFRGGLEAAEVTNLLTQVRSYFQSYGESNFTLIGSDPSSRPTIKRKGFREIHAGEMQYFVFQEAMHDEILQGFSSGWAVKVLLKKGILKPGEEGRPTVNKRLPERTGTTRVYHVTPEVLAEGGDHED